MKPQFIEQNGQRAFVVLPYNEYEELIDALALTHAREEEDGTDLPHSVIKRLYVDEDNPIKVIREWRNLTQEDLAVKSSLTKNFICLLETGKRNLTSKTAATLAKALNVDIDVLKDN